jgi:hypothetical protein
MSETISLNTNNSQNDNSYQEKDKINTLDNLLNMPNILDKEEEEEEIKEQNKNPTIEISNPLKEKKEMKLASISSSEQYKKALDNTEKDTINEPVSDTIKRDLYLIWTKLKYVINPFVNEKERNKHVRQWDLWGPLIFTILLSFTLAFRSKEKSDIFILIFMLFWGGSFLVYLNTNLLGLSISFFQIYCLLGYCLFPLNIAALVLSFERFYEIIRIIIVGFGCSWSTYSMIGFLKNYANDQQRGLVLYPAFLMYLFISGVIIMNRF